MTVPLLRTQRLILRPMGPGDMDDVIRHAGDFAVSKWLVPVPHPYTRADAADFLAMDRAGDLGRLWAITKGGPLIGVISIGKELGYWLGIGDWGQGLMTEAGKAAIAAHFDTSTDNLIRSSHFTDNHGSRRVLEKLGFVDIGSHVHYSRARQSDVSGRAMELTRDRWLAMHDA